MRQRVQVMASILALVIGMSAVSAQEPSAGKRPCSSNDECDQLAFEQVDRRLAAFVPSILAYIDGFAHPTTREVAKAEFAEAQQGWLAFRDRACKAEAALMFLRSARTTAGYTSGCLLHMTSQRLDELQRRFPLADRPK